MTEMQRMTHATMIALITLSTLRHLWDIGVSPGTAIDYVALAFPALASLVGGHFVGHHRTERMAYALCASFWMFVAVLLVAGIGFGVAVASYAIATTHGIVIEPSLTSSLKWFVFKTLTLALGMLLTTLCLGIVFIAHQYIAGSRRRGKTTA